MTRREFSKHMAIIAAVGGHALPEHVLAIEETYYRNTADLQGRVICIMEMQLGFSGTPADNTHRVRLMDGERLMLEYCFNQRCSVEWSAQNIPLLATEEGFHIEHDGPEWSQPIGTVHFVDMDGVIHHASFTSLLTS